MASPPIKAETLEVTAKILDGNKWKKRYFIFEKLSFANFGVLRVFKVAKWSRKTLSKKQTLTLENVFGVESGFHLDNEKYTLAIIMQNGIIVLALENQNDLGTWEWSIRRLFGCSFQYSVFPVEMPCSFNEICTISTSPIRLHLHNGCFCLTTDSPPRILAHFRLADVRRFGAFENKFCIEAGSKCGEWAGVYVFRTGRCDQMTSTFRLASHERLQDFITKENLDSESPPNHLELIKITPASPPLDYARLACTKSLDIDAGSSLPIPQSAKSTRSMAFSLWDVPITNNATSPVEYAKIDCVATQAARKARKEDHIRSISTASSSDAVKKKRKKGWFQNFNISIRGVPGYQRIR